MLYSIQTLKRLKPEFFREDLIALFDLLQQKKIKPLIAQRFPLAEARHAQELLGKGGVTGKIVLVVNADYTARLPSANPLAAASALSSGRVLKAIAAPGATL